MDASNTPKKKPLPGVLATEVLRRLAAECEAPVFPAVDRNYKEPQTPAQLRERIAAIGKTAVFSSDVVNESMDLCEELVKRIEALSMALMPFATHGLMMANMQMCLIGANRPSEPAGGTWLNGLQQAQMQSNVGIFYGAADIVGRNAVEERCIAIFKQIQEVNAAVAERDAHVADNTLQGPIGGPVGGRIH